MEYEKQHVHNIYDKIAEHFSSTRYVIWDWIEEFLTSKIPPKSIVLDIGCGNGRCMNIGDHNYIGIEQCQKFLEICQKQNKNVIKSDMCNLQLLENSVDNIICIAVFHHLSTNTRRIKALQEMKRVMKPNGKILLSVWSKNQPPKIKRTFKYGANMVSWNKYGQVYNRYYYIFGIEEIKKIFATVGLTIISHTWDCGNEIFILSN